MSELINRIGLVTGGSRGIGKAIALALANAGARVAVNYHERAEEAASVVEAIHRIGGRAVAIGADVSIAVSVQSMISTVEERLGRRRAWLNSRLVKRREPIVYDSLSAAVR